MPIARQHSETEVQELYGRICNKIIAVADINKPTIIYIIFFKVDKTWHRFYLDAGLLFWDEGIGPNQEEDILDNEDYLDLSIRFGFMDKKIALIKMQERKLVIRFDDKTGFQITEKEDESHLKILSD